jgi:hypothetical protein
MSTGFAGAVVNSQARTKMPVGNPINGNSHNQVLVKRWQSASRRVTNGH